MNPSSYPPNPQGSPYPPYTPPPVPPPQKNDPHLKLLAPFSALWTSPAKTIARLKHEESPVYTLLLNAIAGIPLMLLVLMMGATGDTSLLLVLASAFFAGPVVGLVTGYVSTWIVGAIGRGAMDGTGTNAQVLRLTAWASVPRMYSIPLYLILIAIFGVNALTDESYREAWETTVLYGIFGLILLLELWSFVCYVAGLAEIMEFSTSVALWNYAAVLIQLYFWPRAVMLIIAYIQSQ